MNNKIPVRQFAEKLASDCNVSQDVAQQYIKLYFDNVVEILRSGNSVDIAGLGTFSLTHSSDSPVEFTPDADAAAEVNSPFEIFEPTELPDGVGERELLEESNMEVPEVKEPEEIEQSEPTEEELIEKPNNSEDTANSESIADSQETVEAAVVADIEETATCVIPESEPAEPFEPTEPEVELLDLDESVSDSTSTASIDANTTTDYSGDIPEDEEEYVTEETEQISPKSSSFGMGFLVGILTGLLIGAMAIFLYAMYYVNTPTPSL